VLRFLVDQNPVALNISDRAGSLPIHAACRAGAPLEILQFLVEAGGAWTVRAWDLSGALPLHLLSEAQQSVEAIKYLLESYPNSASIQTHDGDFPVMVAVKSLASESVIFVLSRAQPEHLQDLYQSYKM